MNFKDLMWNVSEREYREYRCLSYSLLSKFYKGGFNSLSTLFESFSSPSLEFGSAVDTLLTEGVEEFKKKYCVCPDLILSDTLKKITENLFDAVSGMEFDSIPDSIISDICIENDYYKDDKYKNTRVKKIRNECKDYYDLLSKAIGKTVLKQATFDRVITAAKAVKEKYYMFSNPTPFENIERYYQSKFKITIGDIEYKIMVDALEIDHDSKTIRLYDLKTTSDPEYEFPNNYLKWNYHIQSKLYYYVVNQILQNSEDFKEYKVESFQFIVVNGYNPKPLLWNDSQAYNLDGIINPLELGEQLQYYLDTKPLYPIEIKEDINDIYDFI